MKNVLIVLGVIAAAALLGIGWAISVKNGLIAADEGVWRLTPPETPDGAWQEELLLDCPVSDAVLVDPPRKGLEPEVIAAIAQAGPSRVVYVSCNPATLARDIRFFVDAGYGIQAIQPVDMFGYASDVETVVELTLAHTA